MKISLESKEYDAPIMVSGRPSDLAWFAKAVLKSVGDPPRDDASYVVFHVEPDADARARREEQDLRWEDDTIARAAAIVAKRKGAK